MRKTISIAIALLCLLVCARVALADQDEETEAEVTDEIADEIEGSIERALATADLHEIESFYNEYASQLKPVTGGTDLKSFITTLAKGGADFDMSQVYAFVLDALFNGVRQSIPAIVQVIVIALLFSVISHFAPSFGKSGVSKTAGTAQYVIVGTITIGVLVSAFAVGTDAIANMSAFAKEFFPLLIALLTALGGITSAAILSPATVFLTTGISMFYHSIVLPLVIVLTVLTVINNFSDNVKLSGFCSLIKSVVKWAIGISFTVFLGLVAIQGLVGSTFDGVSIKTAKYTIDKFVPIVGGMFSDTADVLISCTLLIKNAVGIAGIVIIAAMMLAPVLSILAHYFLLKLAGAVVEPIAGEKPGKFFADAADVLLLLFAAVLAAAAMCFITVAVIIGAGNTNLMLR